MYGTLMEEKAREEYTTHQQQINHPGLTTEMSGLVISIDNPWLAASLNGVVHDPTAISHQETTRLLFSTTVPNVLL